MNERVGLIGKLPAHGDFVRRGPASVATYLEKWLDEELGRIDPELRGAIMAEFPTWTFIARLPASDIAGAMCASCDRVGRLYPLLIFADRVDAAMLVARADALRKVLSAIPADITADALTAAARFVPNRDAAILPPSSGSVWWQHTITDAIAFPDLPCAADVVALLAKEPA